MEFDKNDTKYIKGIAICFMLWHHLFGAPLRLAENSFTSLITLNENQLATTIALFCKLCVALFTVLSGYGIYKSSQRSVNDGHFIGRHILRLYKNVWLIFVMAMPVYVYKYRDFGSSIISESIYNFFGLKATFNREWWFIFPYAILLACFPAIKRFVDRSRASFAGDTIILALFSAFYIYILPPIMESSVFSDFSGTIFYGNMSLTFSILPSFVAGCMLARYDILSTVKNKLAGRGIWCAAAVVLMLAVFIVRFSSSVLYDFIYAPVYIICFLILMPTKPFRLCSKVFMALGEESAVMWLVHSFFCYYWGQKLVYFPKYPVIIFIWCTILSFFTAKIIDKIRVWLERLYAKAMCPKA